MSGFRNVISTATTAATALNNSDVAAVGLSYFVFYKGSQDELSDVVQESILVYRSKHV